MENGTQRCQSASQVCLCLDVYSVDAGHDAGKPLAILCDLCAACRVTLLRLQKIRRTTSSAQHKLTDGALR